MASRRFVQCDVFTDRPTRGNGLAVVVDGEGLSEEDMQAFAAWTNLAETTFLMPPTVAEADYKVRIYTPVREMLFAGHPTLGSCAAWLRCGGVPRDPGMVRQECGVGIVAIDQTGAAPAFAAPDTTVEPLPDEALDRILTTLDIAPDRVVRTARLTNGPVWQALELASATDVLAVDATRVRYPEFQPIGLFGAHPAGSECQYETRMLAPSSGMAEDPITGSLNAALARWMVGAGHWADPLTIAQGTAIGRQGRVFVRPERGAVQGSGGDTVWIGGQTQFLIDGTVTL